MLNNDVIHVLLSRRNKHSICAVYVQIGNISFDDRARDCSIDLAALLGPGVSFREGLSCFAANVARLQKGVRMFVGEDVHWVTGGIGLCTGDMPQSQSALRLCSFTTVCVLFAQAMPLQMSSPTAIRPCRFCTVDQDCLHDLTFDVEENARSLHEQKALISHIRSLPTRGEQKNASKLAGLLALPNPFFELALDPFTQTPGDPFHKFVAGNGKRILNVLTASLTSRALNALSDRLRVFPLYNNWPSFRLFEQLASWSLDDIKHFLLIAPLLLRGFFVDGVFTSTWNRYCQEQLRQARSVCFLCLVPELNDALQRMSVAEAFMALFRDYAELLSFVYNRVAQPQATERAVEAFGATAVALLGDLVKTPNFHAMLHESKVMKLFGAPLNYDVAAKERRYDQRLPCAIDACVL
jgi:hypothetical protein